MSMMSGWRALVLVLGGGCPAPPPDTACELPFRDSASTCAEAPAIVDALPTGTWSGVSSTINIDDDGEAPACASTLVTITAGTSAGEVVIVGETRSDTATASTFERWVFTGEGAARVEDANGAVTGACACTLTTCACEYAGAVTGARSLAFDRELLLIDEHFESADGFGESHGTGALRGECR